MVRGRGPQPLAEGERLVFRLRANWSVLTLPALILVATSGAASFLAAALPGDAALVPMRLLVAALALAVVGRWALWPFLTWYGRTYTLTTRRLILREGVLARHGTDVPLWRVTDAAVRRSFLQRLLGCGTLTVRTAGDQATIVIPHLPYVEQAQRELYVLAFGDLISPAAERGPAPGSTRWSA
jgi:uncharacterized membrane protein YdbT with pleckstrin-like domain